jgi:hypothetical protein
MTMDLTTNWNSPGLDLQAASTVGRCDICARRTAQRMYDLYEHLDPRVSPLACRSWRLCEECAAAVKTEVERAALRTPLRVRIAVGIVAAERRPAHRQTVLDTDFLEQVPDEEMSGMLVGFILCMIALPPLLFLLVALFLSGGPGH